jgi:hypothetical protein
MKKNSRLPNSLGPNFRQTVLKTVDDGLLNSTVMNDENRRTLKLKTFSWLLNITDLKKRLKANLKLPNMVQKADDGPTVIVQKGKY